MVVFTMSFRRRRPARRFARLHPVESYKHVVDANFVLDTQTGVNVITDIAIQRATQTLDRHAVASEVAKCHIDWIFYDITISNGDTSGSADDWDGYLFKNINNLFTPPTPGNTGTNEIKRQIFLEWKTKLPINDTLTKYVGVVRVPRSLRVIGANDRITFMSRHTCATANIRSKFIYKEVV